MSGSLSLDDLSLSLKRLYAASVEPSLWSEALRGLEDLTGSAGAVINFVPKLGLGEGFVLAGRFSEDICAEFARDYMAICPRTTYAVRHQPDLSYDSMILSEAEMDRDPVYRWFGGLGLRYHVGGALPDVDGLHVNISLQRTPKQGHVEPADIAMFRRLRGHVEQALELGATISSLRGGARASLQILDRLPQGVILIGADREVLFANTAADALLSAGDGVVTRLGMLDVVPVVSRPRFGELLRGAIGLARGAVAGRGGWLSVERVAKPPLHLFIGPIVIDLGTPLRARPAAVVIAHDRSRGLAASFEMLSGLFGLTPTEARLSALLGQGAVLEDAATRLGQSVGTARIHLKAIFAKIGVRRQQDLVRLVSELVSQGLAEPP